MKQKIIIPKAINHKVDIVICKNCGNPFPRFNKINKGRRKTYNNIRPSNVVTCNQKCSKEYQLKQTRKYHGK